MIPVTSATNFDDIDVKFPIRHREHRQLGSGPGLSGGLLEFIAVDVVDVPHRVAPTNGALDLGLFAEVLRGPDQVRRRVTDLAEAHSSGVNITEQSAPLERVIHHEPLGSHPTSLRRGEGRRRHQAIRSKGFTTGFCGKSTSAGVWSRYIAAMYRLDTSKQRKCELGRFVREGGQVRDVGIRDPRPSSRDADARL